MTDEEIKNKMDFLVKKWPTPPSEDSKEWWSYRADRSLWVDYKYKLNGKSRPNEQKEDLSIKKPMALDSYQEAVKLFDE